MNKVSILLFALSLVFMSLTIVEKTVGRLIPSKEMTQVGIIVEDVEKAAEEWAKFVGLEKVPEIKIAVGDDKNPTKYKGDLSDAQAKLAFIKMDNLMIELIEPLGENSTWKEYFDKHGNGIHHIAFKTGDMDKSISLFEKNDINLVQHGGWKTGEYGYFDATEKMGVNIELLENYPR